MPSARQVQVQVQAVPCFVRQRKGTAPPPCSELPPVLADVAQHGHGVVPWIPQRGQRVPPEPVQTCWRRLPSRGRYTGPYRTPGEPRGDRKTVGRSSERGLVAATWRPDGTVSASQSPALSREAPRGSCCVCFAAPSDTTLIAQLSHLTWQRTGSEWARPPLEPTQRVGRKLGVASAATLWSVTGGG